MNCSVVYPGQAYATTRPVAVSDTVDNIGGTLGFVARAIHNRSAASMLVSILSEGGLESVSRINSGSDLSGGTQWKRIRATGTTGGGTSGGVYEAIHTSLAGLAFTNQPANDAIEVLSSSAADTTQSVTVYGTTNGTDTVVAETIALNGTTPVASVKVDWGVILGWELSAPCAGTVTLREASADQTISTATTGVLSKGVESVSAATGLGYNVTPMVTASGATTKQIGLIGTNAAGTTIRDSQALNGATAQVMNSAFNTITKVLTGDLEATRTVTFNNSADLLAYY